MQARTGVRLYALLAAALAAPAAHCESRYVIDQLVVNVNSAPDASGERVATVKSGERVQVLERAGDQVRVRLANGRYGWMRSTYLSPEEPLRSRLARRDAEAAQLKDEVRRLQGQLQAARAPQARTTAVSTASPAAPAAPGASAGDSSRAPGTGSSAEAFEEGSGRSWPWALGAALVGLGLGFVLGAVVLDRHIRSRYGGVRIH